MSDIDPTLTAAVDLLCLDAGNTVIFLDHPRLAELCSREGFMTTAAALVHAEGEAKVALELGEGLDVGWSDAEVLGKRGWALVVATMLSKAGLPAGRIAGVMPALWSAHRTHNLWSVVPDGLREGVARVRALGVRVAVVSNSEGMLDRVLDDLGLLRAFDCVLDSAVVGIEKPDPRIFRVVLDRMRVPPARTVHVGDTYTTDVVGARAAGIRVGLIDVHGHYLRRHLDVPRVRSVAEIAGAIAERRA